MTAGYSWYVGTLVDGRILARLPLVSTSWTHILDDAGTLSGTLLLSNPDNAQMNPYAVAEPCRCFLAVAYVDDQGNETFLNGGPIWTNSYDTTSKNLVIGAAGLWSLWNHRYVLPVLAAGQQVAEISATYSGLTLATIAKRLLQLAFTHTGGSVPVVFPDDVIGTAARTYNGYEMTAVGQALQDLTGVEGGPELQFIPRRQTSNPRYIEWLMRAGTTDAPLLSQVGADWAFDASAANSPVGNVSVNRDGSGMAIRQWVQGSGTDISTLFGVAEDDTLIGAGFPLLEANDGNHSTVSDQATLDGYASADLALAGRPTETWTITVQRDTAPNVSTYRQGDYVQLRIGGLNPDGTPKEPFIPEGTYRTRIVQISGSDANTVDLQLAPILGGV